MIADMVTGLGVLAVVCLVVAVWDYRRQLKHAGNKARMDAFLRDRYGA